MRQISSKEEVSKPVDDEKKFEVVGKERLVMKTEVTEEEVEEIRVAVLKMEVEEEGE